MMEGIFVSVVMNGPSTKVLINQFDGTKHANDVILSKTDFASLMFELNG